MQSHDEKPLTGVIDSGAAPQRACAHGRPVTLVLPGFFTYGATVDGAGNKFQASPSVRGHFRYRCHVSRFFAALSRAGQAITGPDVPAFR